MGVFVCDSCESVENTALGHYWSRGLGLYDPDVDRNALCSECMPAQYKDGKHNKDGGKWHGKFPKVK
jgi:hypothetical protein